MKQKIKRTKVDVKATNTAFFLMFPCLIIAGVAGLYAPFSAKVLALALSVYQFLMIKKFIEDYYKLI